MKQILLFCVSMLICVACGKKQTQEVAIQNSKIKNSESQGLQIQDSVKNSEMTGNDRDEHGCIGSAGYTWSVVRDSCIRIFQVGIRLNPRDASLEQSLVTFVVFRTKAIGDTAEVFMPHNKMIMLKTKPETDIWAYEDYKLTHSKGDFSLTKSDKILYSGKMY